jgi:hypothetical protein
MGMMRAMTVQDWSAAIKPSSLRSSVGKTTRLKCLMGVIPIRIGSITLDGTALNQHTPYERARLAHCGADPRRRGCPAEPRRAVGRIGAGRSVERRAGTEHAGAAARREPCRRRCRQWRSGLPGRDGAGRPATDRAAHRVRHDRRRRAVVRRRAERCADDRAAHGSRCVRAVLLAWVRAGFALPGTDTCCPRSAKACGASGTGLRLPAHDFQAQLGLEVRAGWGPHPQPV